MITDEQALEWARNKVDTTDDDFLAGSAQQLICALEGKEEY